MEEPLEVIGFDTTTEYGVTTRPATEDFTQLLIYFPKIGIGRPFAEGITDNDIFQTTNFYRGVWVYIDLEDVAAFSYDENGDTILFLRNAIEIRGGTQIGTTTVVAVDGQVNHIMYNDENLIELIVPSEDVTLPPDADGLAAFQALPDALTAETIPGTDPIQLDERGAVIRNGNGTVVQGQPGTQVSDTTQTWRTSWQ